MIDRRSLVTRHNPQYTTLNTAAPLSVGNGRFCFTADCTGLQTFFDEYAAASDAFPLCTMAEWGWHAYPPQPGDEAGLRLTPFDTYGRTVHYAVDDSGQEERFKRIRQSAHKFHLGVIAFEYRGRPPALAECTPVRQTLDMWEGVLHSEFSINGVGVTVETFVHPDADRLYIRAVSPLLEDGSLRITLRFPCGSHKKTGADFHGVPQPEKHRTRALPAADGGRVSRVEREMDGTRYMVTIAGSGIAANVIEPEHAVIITARSAAVELGIGFDPLRIPAPDSIIPPAQSTDAFAPFSPFTEARGKCASFWEGWWNSGGAIDFSRSSDSRAMELERRIVLSQYLIAIQSRGLVPPAETGLTCNSWYGKFHLEMHYWHHAWFALWGRTDELKRSLAYYKKILPAAREIAASQGYAGARWPKMCDPSGRNTPSAIAVLLIWQQPHPIMLAELCYRAAPDADFLREYRDLIVETAEFMRSFIHWDEGTGGDKCRGRYVLGPPYIPAQERHDPRIVLNAPYELEYFRWAFRAADEWLVRLGEAPRYAQFADQLALPAQRDGVYLAHENCPDTFSRLPFYTDHPSMLAMYGVLNSEKIDPAVMSATLDTVLAVWDQKTFYGWDFPMMAMTACRLGRREDAVRLLLMDSPKNTFSPNGHNRMVGDDALPLYLPGNGGLLIAAAMMAAGFGENGGSFPDGFTAQVEGIDAYI